MATTTKSPEEERTDDLHNPAKELADREFDEIVNNPNTAKHPLGDKEADAYGVRDAEKNPQAPEKKAIDETAAGKAAVAAGTAATGVVGGAVVKLLGKIKVKRLGVGSLIALFLVSTFVLISTFLGPGLLIVQVKETLADKYNDLFATMDERSNLIIKKKLGLTNGICRDGIKVLCRFNGFSGKQLKAFEKAGFKVNTDGKTISGKTKVTSIEAPDGTKITAANLDEVLKSQNFEVRRAFSRAFNPRYVAYADKVFDGLRIKLRLTKQKNVSGVTEEELDKSTKNTLEGKNAAGEDLGRVKTTTDPDGTVRDQYGNVLTDAELKDLNEFNSAIEKTTKDLAEVGKTASFSMAKSGFMALSGVGVIDGICTAYNYLQLVGFGAKLIEAQQLIRFAFLFLNTGDLIKAGDATPQIVSYIGKKLTDLDQYKEAFTDAFFYKFAAFGDLKFPKGKTDGETADRKTAIMQYALGDGIAGTLTDLVAWVRQLTGGQIDNVCKAVKSFWGQLGLIVLSIGATVFSGGLNIGVGVFVFGTAQAAISVALALALPKIMNIIAQTLVTPNTIGGNAGNAAVGGMGALNAQNAAAHGLSPLKKSNVLEYMNRTKRIASEYDKAERMAANPFDYMNPVTPAYAVATAVNTQFSSPAKFIRNPLTIFQNAASSLFSPVARAADPMEEFNICEDKIYTMAEYAADPTCNIRYGLGGDELGFDPETVTQWMYDHDYIDNDGKAIDGTEYADYIDNCMNRAMPLGSTGEDSQENDGGICSSQEAKYKYFRIFFVDDSIANSMDEEDNSADVATPVSAPTGPSVGGWTWPIAGKSEKNVTWRWGQSTPRGIHKGIDIGSPVGTPILAAHDGVVTDKSYDSSTCGRMYLIKATGTNVWMGYQHLATGGTRLPPGTPVTMGQKIGVLGPAGGTTCGVGNFYHLHFSIELTEHISYYSDPLSLSDDPLKYLP